MWRPLASLSFSLSLPAVVVEPSSFRPLWLLALRSPTTTERTAHSLEQGLRSHSLTARPVLPTSLQSHCVLCWPRHCLCVCLGLWPSLRSLARSGPQSLSRHRAVSTHGNARPAATLPDLYLTVDKLVHYLLLVLLLPSSVPSYFSTDIIHQPHCLGIRSRERLDTIPTGRWWLIPVSRCPPLRCV